MYIIRRRDKMEALSVDIERGDFMEDRIIGGLRRDKQGDHSRAKEKLRK